MVGILTILLMFTGIPTALFFYMQWKISGKMLCWFLEDDISAVPELNAIEGDFIMSEDGGYDVEAEKVRLVRYPLGWPRQLQQIVPASLYRRGNAIPLNWVTLEARSVSARELAAVLDENWLRNLVKGAREGMGVSKFEKMIPMLTLAVMGISLLLLFVMFTRIGGLTEALKVIKP